MNKRYLPKTTLFVVVLILIVGIVGYFALKKFEQENQQSAVSTDSTVTWKTYKNTEFEFKYPNTWVLEAEDNDFLDIHLTNYKITEDQVDCNKFIGMEIQAFHPFQGLFDTFVKTQVNFEGMGPKGKLISTTIGGHSAYKVDESGWAGSCGGPGYFIKANNTQYIYIFSGRSKETDQNIIDQILSTFKFTR